MLRELLNAAYARLRLGRDEGELAELDDLLEKPEPVEGARRRPKGNAGMAALMAATRLPQAGAAVGPRPAGAR